MFNAASFADSHQHLTMTRYLPQRSLPPWSYVPGEFPHPHRDTQGHSCGIEPKEATPPTRTGWRECENYLWGIDLFNAGFYWEAHEAWEQAWISVGRQGTIADFLKALIKLAAAGVKAREGREEGVARHARRCLALLSAPEQSDQTDFLGLDFPDLRTAAQRIIDNAAAITQRAAEDNQAHTLPIDLVLH